VHEFAKAGVAESGQTGAGPLNTISSASPATMILSTLIKLSARSEAFAAISLSQSFPDLQCTQ
jgi:hypothetical protein